MTDTDRTVAEIIERLQRWAESGRLDGFYSERGCDELEAAAALFEWRQIALDGYLAGMEEAAKMVENSIAEYEDLIARGKGTWPQPNYIRDETWTAWYAKASAHRRDAATIRARIEQIKEGQ